MGNLASLFETTTEIPDVANGDKKTGNLTEPPEALFGKHSYLLRYWNKLDACQRSDLIAQFKGIDTNRAEKAFRESVLAENFEGAEAIADDHYVVSSEISSETAQLYFDAGLEAIAHGKVAALVLAGGQGTRLGSALPKGVIPLGLNPDCNTLFALQAYRIARLQKLARRKYPHCDCVVKWYVMTSKYTVDETRKYLEGSVEKFGLSMDNIHIFVQGLMPCFDHDGYFILADRASIATAPNGNGGVYEALAPHLRSMRSNSIEYVHVYCVDNILCRVADPQFIGFCMLNNVDCAAKVVEKTDPEESVGLFCKQNGKVKLAEYSEIPKDLANLRNSFGRLVFRAGNIANHVFSMSFLEKVCVEVTNLPYHRALKKIPFFDGSEVVKPSLPNGVKLEQFVTDVFQFSSNFYLWEVDRKQEFSPLKNAEAAGKDCLSTCLRDLRAEHARWLRNAGVSVQDESTVFINPLRSYKGEELNEREENTTQAS